MRSKLITCAAVLCAAVIPAFAQQVYGTGLDQLPPGVNPITGARPGNPIGVGASLPFSNRASNITPQDTHSIIAPNLPAPPVPHPASALDYLIAARQALAVGHTGEAQEALERAEARALDRAVPPSEANEPIRDPLVDAIERARLALAANDIPRTIELVASASDVAERLAEGTVR